ncbi:hypothetical protein LNP74_06685 [Klebsiella pneumoniae subsp. pneumoniae]|nr:hypothetical protein [Klebsiella pneumoniae subsp. pneumoniae]
MTRAPSPSGPSKKIIEKFAEQFAALSDGYLKERAGDLRTLGQRLLFHLDDSIQGPNTWPARIILVADELSATTLAEVPQDRLAGVVVRDGAANSHAAIMVRALGIPTVMGADIQPSLLHGHTLIVDGYRGELLVDPEPVLLQELSAPYQRRERTQPPGGGRSPARVGAEKRRAGESHAQRRLKPGARREARQLC